MQTPIPSVLAASLLLAGCAQSPAPAATTAPAQEAASVPEAAIANETTAPFALHLQSDLTLAPDPPASEGSVAPAIVANGPWVEDRAYPTWTATLDRAAGNGTASVTFFVTSSSASFAATLLPAFSELPQFTVALGDGTSESQARASGPAVLRAGEVVEVRAEVPLDGLKLAPGTALSLRLQPYYSQVAVAEEVRFLMGPEHPARVELGS